MTMLHAPHRLPIPATPLVGRERETALARTLLLRPHVRLLTITGPGGIGKTRLSLQIASNLVDAYEDGVRFIPLAAVSDASLVAASLADALGVRETGGGSVRERLVEALRESETLLVVDNFEHLLAAAPFLTELLETCPRLRFLVTSRTLLRVAGEHALPVPALAVPDGDPPLARLVESPAVQLFTDRAQAVRPSFELTENTAPIVAEICRLLDGIPLAIELAAARVTHLSLTSLQERLQQRLPLLTGGARDRPDRHRTMRDAIAWSYELLAPEEQGLFRRLAVFAGGFAGEAAEALFGPTGVGTEKWDGDATPMSVLEGIAALVDASLLHHELGSEGAARYRMLETIREFAAEQLAETGEGQMTFGAHAGYFLAFAEQHSSSRFLPHDQRLLLHLAPEQTNLRAALVWLAAHGEAAEFARLAIALGWFWYLKGHLEDCRAWLERALSRGEALPAAVRFELGILLGLTAMEQDELARARQVMSECLALARAADDAPGIVQAQIVLACLALIEGAYEQATTLLEEALACARSLPDPRLATWLANVALANLGVAALSLGRLAAAASFHEAALAGQRAGGDIWGELLSLVDLGDVALSQGDEERAAAYFREGLALAHTYGEQRAIADTLEGLGFAETIPRPSYAVQLFAAAERLREATGIAVRGLLERAAYERGVAAARKALGDEAFAAAWAAGRALPLAEAIVAALTPGVAPALAPSGPFTPRETEILQLLVTGMPDRAIAEALFISVRTVENHVNRILTKLHVRTRTAAVSAAIAAGFVNPGPPPA